MRSDAEKIELTNLLQALAAPFRVECDVALYFGYLMALEGLSIESIRRAIRRACLECRFMPTGAELRNLAGVESPDARALLAWNKVKSAIQRFGAYLSVYFDDPVTNAVVHVMGGWVLLCATGSGDDFNKWAAQRFEKIYVELWQTGVPEGLTRPHLGLSDQSNVANGHTNDVKQPVMIACGLIPDPSRLKLPNPPSPGISEAP